MITEFEYEFTGEDFSIFVEVEAETFYHAGQYSGLPEDCTPDYSGFEILHIELPKGITLSKDRTEELEKEIAVELFHNWDKHFAENQIDLEDYNYG